MRALLAQLFSFLRSPSKIFPLVFVLIITYSLIYLLLIDPLSSRKDSKNFFSLNHITHIYRNNKAQKNLSKQRLVEDGHGVWVPDRQIQIMSAIFDIHSQQKQVVLQSYLKHSVKRDFVCCFSKDVDLEDYYEVPAVLEHIDLRWITDYQSAKFSCSLPDEKTYNLVTFAPLSCGVNTTQPKSIFHPSRRKWEFAVCMKLDDFYIEPAHLVEWIEFMLEIGTSKVLVFYSNLHPGTERVLSYYVKLGDVDLLEYKPSLLGGKFRQHHQDLALTVLECQYRLAGFDWVIPLKFGQIPVPISPHSSLNWVLQTLLLNKTNASAFQIDPILLPAEWNSNTEDLHFWSFHKGLKFENKYSVWAFIPSRTEVASSHHHIPKDKYQQFTLPPDLLHLLHMADCKTTWPDINCKESQPTSPSEESLSPFTQAVMLRLQRLPLASLISDQAYIRKIQQAKVVYKSK